MNLTQFLNYLLPYVCILCKMKSDRYQDLCKGCYVDLPFYPGNGNALFQYQSPITELILAIKFQHQLVYARVLGELLAEKCQKYYKNHPRPKVIIPIPLHPKRLKERGFNQALELARPLARFLDLPLQTRKVWRIKPTIAQATLVKSKRKSNMANAFHVKIDDEHVAVLDDVITTGNTMEEFCRTLTLAGVKKIDTWCIAKPLFVGKD